MIKVETSNGVVSLKMKGPGMEVVRDILSIIESIYNGFEKKTEKGAGDELLVIIGTALQQGKIQEWGKETDDE